MAEGWNYKLTADQVRAIYKAAHGGLDSLRQIAIRYGVTHTTVRQIRDQEIWKSLWEEQT